MIYIKSKREIELLKEAGRYNILTMNEIAKNIKVGITTKELDKIAYDFITNNGCVPSCLGYEGYPATLCTSVNDEVVHGIPNNRKLKMAILYRSI
jgi:Methionine aminopeptidase